MLQVLDDQIQNYSAPLEAVEDLKSYDKDKLKEIQSNLLSLLAMRHTYLLELYDREIDIGNDAAEKIRVLVMTKTKFNELLSSGQRKALGKDIPIFLVKDEYQRNDMEDEILSMSMADGILLVGDPYQAPKQRTQSVENKNNKSILTANWLKNKQISDFVATLPVMDTYRLGPSMVNVIRKVFPALQQMNSSRTKDTSFLPVLLDRSWDWTYHRKPGDDNDNQEVARDKHYFSVLLTITSIELAIQWFSRDTTDLRDGFVIMSPWNILLDNVKIFLYHTLMNSIAWILQQHGVAEQLVRTHWNYSRLVDKGFLRFISIAAANGVDCKKALVLLPHRKYGDWGWRGDPTEDHHCLVFLSRASDRLWLLAEDLSGEVIVQTREQNSPPSVLTLREAIDRRIDTTESLTKRISQSRSQLKLARLMEECRKQWKILGIPPKWQNNMTPNAINAIPIFASRKAKDLMIQDGDNRKAWPLISDLFSQPARVHDIMNRCAKQYSQAEAICTWATVANEIGIKKLKLTTALSVADVFGSWSSFQQNMRQLSAAPEQKKKEKSSTCKRSTHFSLEIREAKARSSLNHIPEQCGPKQEATSFPAPQ